MIVAIDGPAGSGKSTVARVVAETTGFLYLNSGKIYRAITFAALSKKIELSDQAFIQLLPTLSIEISPEGLGLNGENVDSSLHTDQVDRWVAEVSSFPRVRDHVNEILKQEARGRDVVVEGRDMTTVVFPDAEVKWFIDATAQARARRRFDQGTSKLSFEELLESIETRDRIDRGKKVGALALAADAAYLDTSDLTIEAVCDKVIESIQGHKSPQE